MAQPNNLPPIVQAPDPIISPITEPSVLEKGASQTNNATQEFVLVSWEDDNDPHNPYNWSQSRKWFTTVLTSLGGLVTLMSGVMLAPALSVISDDLDISEAVVSMALSIYVLAFAFGPLILAPCSEVWGRRPIWIWGAAYYTLWNTVCGFSKNNGLLIVGRLMAGLGASAEFAVSGAIVADCWRSDERGKAMAIRSFLPLMGPAIGPIVGGAMVQHVSWRWLFWTLSIFDGLILLLFIFFLPETYAKKLLSRKAKRLRNSSGKPHSADHEIDSPSILQRVKVAMMRPTRLLATQPVIQIVALILAYQFGLLYIALSTFSDLWVKRYHQSKTASGLHYLALIIGYTIASQGGGWATDRLWAWFKKKNNGETRPENRVPLMIPGALLIPVGLLWYGWAAQKHMHWAMVDVGAAMFGCGYISSGYAAQLYIVEAFLEYNASAGAASQLLRNVFAFAFPIFAPSLYKTLDYGIGNTVLAAIALVFGITVPFVLWTYGERLRQKGGIQK